MFALLGALVAVALAGSKAMCLGNGVGRGRKFAVDSGVAVATCIGPMIVIALATATVKYCIARKGWYWFGKISKDLSGVDADLLDDMARERRNRINHLREAERGRGTVRNRQTSSMHPRVQQQEEEGV